MNKFLLAMGVMVLPFTSLIARSERCLPCLMQIMVPYCQALYKAGLLKSEASFYDPDLPLYNQPYHQICEYGLAVWYEGENIPQRYTTENKKLSPAQQIESLCVPLINQGLMLSIQHADCIRFYQTNPWPGDS